jgi:Tol biopolymer transport system component
VAAPEWPWISDLLWLPDGSGMLVTVAERQQPRQIWFLPRNSSAARKITSDISMYGSISVTADSKSIVAQRADVTANLFVVDTQQPSKPRALTTGLWNCFGASGVRWVPGGRILYTVCGAGSTLNVIDPVTADSRQIGRLNRTWQPAVSPDGQHIAFVSDRSGPEEIWVCDINGNDVRQLTHKGPARFPCWSPDSKSVYFNTQGTDQVVWRVTIDGKAEQVVKYPTNSPDISPDGRFLLLRVRSSDPKTQLWRTAIVPVSSPDSPRFLPVPRNGGPPRAQWINSTSFAYLDYIGGISNLWSENADGGAARQITRFDSGEILSYDVSRDGRYIAMSHGEHVNDIVLIRDFR